MPVPIQVHFDSTMGFRDAIAYEFFMDNIKDVFHDFQGTDGETVNEFLEKLAKASYIIADKFLAAREQSLTTEEDESSTEES